MTAMDFASLDLPKTWGVKPIREVYTFTKKPRHLNIPTDTSLPFLSMDTIPIGRVHVSTFEERAASMLTSGTYIENGDLLVAKITPSFENGKQAIVDWNRPFGYATTEVIPLQEIESVSDKHFLFHLLLHPEIRSGLAGKMDGTTGRQRLSKDVLGDYVIPVPPLLEQRKIASVLGLVQRAMEQQEGLIALTTELKKSLMHRLFTEGLRGERQKQTEIGPMPESWEIVAVEELIGLKHGYSFRSQYFSASGPIVLTPGNFKLDGGLYWGSRTKYTSETYSPELVLSSGDLVVVMTDLTPSAKLLGTPAFIPEGTLALHNQRIGKVNVKSPKTSKEFLYWLFLTERFKQHMVLTATGSTVRHTSPRRIGEYKFALPTTKEQKEIADILFRADRKVQIGEAKRNALTALFRTLLHQLMTVQIRVHDLDLSHLGVAETTA